MKTNLTLAFSLFFFVVSFAQNTYKPGKITKKNGELVNGYFRIHKDKMIIQAIKPEYANESMTFKQWRPSDIQKGAIKGIVYKPFAYQKDSILLKEMLVGGISLYAHINEKADTEYYIFENQNLTKLPNKTDQPNDLKSMLSKLATGCTNVVVPQTFQSIEKKYFAQLYNLIYESNSCKYPKISIKQRVNPDTSNFHFGLMIGSNLNFFYLSDARGNRSANGAVYGGGFQSSQPGYNLGIFTEFELSQRWHVGGELFLTNKAATLERVGIFGPSDGKFDARFVQLSFLTKYGFSKQGIIPFLSLGTFGQNKLNAVSTISYTDETVPVDPTFYDQFNVDIGFLGGIGVSRDNGKYFWDLNLRIHWARPTNQVSVLNKINNYAYQLILKIGI